MKLNSTLIAGAAALAFVAAGASSLQAQVTNLVAITAIAEPQGDTNVANGLILFNTPTKVAVNTQTILAKLALDKHAQGVFNATNFPSGSKLAMIVSNTSVMAFQVLSKTNSVLADVSDIVSFSTNATPFVFSGKINALDYATSRSVVPDPSLTTLLIANISYNDSGIAGGQNLRFYLTGLVKLMDTHTPIGKSGAYSKKITFVMTPLVGAGTNQGDRFVIVSGNLTASGKALVAP
jgi:hypothetical protein